MLTFVLNKITLLSFLLIQLLYLKSKYLLLTIAICMILVLNFSSKDPYTLLEISAMISTLCIIKCRAKFGLQVCIYLISVATGCLFFAFYKNSWSFLIELSSQKTLPLEQKQIKECFFSIAMTLILGGIPFVEWMMRIFSTLKPITKTLGFILPLFISLSVYQNLVIKGLDFTTIGCLICLCSSLQIFFLKNIKIIFCNIITFFYGCAIIAISNHLNNYDIYFVLIAVLIISIENFFMPKITLKYRMKNFKDIFLSNKSDKAIFLLYMFCLFTIYFAFYLNIFLDKPYDLITKFSILSISCFFGKIAFFILNKKLDTSHYNRAVNTKEIAKALVFLLFLLSSIIALFTTNYKTFQFSSTLNLIFKLGAFFFVCFMFCLIFKSISKINVPTQVNFSNVGKRIFIIFNSAKISYEILCSILSDTLFALKQGNNAFNTNSFLSNLNNFFKKNVILYYSVFIVILCIVLIIECVISR